MSLVHALVNYARVTTEKAIANNRYDLSSCTKAVQITPLRIACNLYI
ncbi:hypothetical protein [Synechocystis sp. LEGE 06083]|nr:hypothetical protein [Synechocystis sp. LEGE 06083]